MTKTATKTDLDTPPKWDLADLFKGLDDPEIDKVLSYADGNSASFQKEFAGKLASLSGAAFGAAIARYEDILEGAFKVMSYAQLLHAADTANQEIAQFHQSCQERVNGITGTFLSFTLELNRIEDDALNEQL
ncbi:MAG: oligoendopeptidase F, partial [Rhodospirillales bacterium]